MKKHLVVDVFACRGTSYEVGKQLAEAYVRTRGKGARWPQGRQVIRNFKFEDAKRTLRAYAPNLWEEIHGIADGLGLSVEHATAAYSNGRLAYPRSGCSTTMRDGLYGRNYDYLLSRYDHALVAIQAKGTYASIGFADRYTGRVDGMNEQGLCIGLHYVNDAVWKPGLVSILIVRAVLDQCATTAEAVHFLRRVPHGLSFNYSILDKSDDAAVVEACPAEVVVRRGYPLACTNHFTSADLADYNRTDLRGTRRRLVALEHRSAESHDSQTLFAFLRNARLPIVQLGYRSGFGTLHTVVCHPQSLALQVGVGRQSEVLTIDFHAWLEGNALDAASHSGAISSRDSKLVLGRSMEGSVFKDVNLGSAHFDDVNFAGTEITENCNVRGMTIAGIAVTDLLAAYRSSKNSPDSKDSK